MLDHKELAAFIDEYGHLKDLKKKLMEIEVLGDIRINEYQGHLDMFPDVSHPFTIEQFKQNQEEYKEKLEKQVFTLTQTLGLANPL